MLYMIAIYGTKQMCYFFFIFIFKCPVPVYNYIPKRTSSIDGSYSVSFVNGKKLWYLQFSKIEEKQKKKDGFLFIYKIRYILKILLLDSLISITY